MEHQRTTKLIPKRESILNQNIRDQIHHLLNHEYRLARPSRILLNIDRDGDLGNGRSVRVIDQNAPRVRISSEGPPQSYIRDISSGRRSAPRLLVDCATQTSPALTAGGSNKNLNGSVPNASISETETLSIVKMTEQERMDNLRELLQADYYYGFRPRSPYDPCLEYQLYFRKGQNRHKIRSMSAPRLPTGSETILMQSRSSQTIVVDSTPHPPRPAPRNIVTSDSAWTPSTEASTPTNADIATKSKTIATIQPNYAPGTANVDEYFFFRQSRRTDPNRDINYRQFSEYNVDPHGRSIEKINSYLDISDSSRAAATPHSDYHTQSQLLPPTQQVVVDIKDLKRGRGAKSAKLSHSTIEMTSVVKNKTSVQGVTVKDTSPDKFTIQILNPNGVESILNNQNISGAPSGQLRHSVQTMVHSSPNSSPKIAHKLEAEKYDLNGPSRPRQKPYVLGCADIEQSNTYGRLPPPPQSQRSQTQPQPAIRTTTYQEYPQGQYQQYYYPKPYQSPYVNEAADQPLQYEYYVIEEPVPQSQVQPQPQPQPQVLVKENRPPTKPHKPNYASYYDQYQYYQKYYQRKSPSRSSEHRSVSPPSQRFVRNESDMVNELKQMKHKKEYEVAAADALKSPANQERIRQIMEESRRIEAQMREQQKQQMNQYQHYNSNPDIIDVDFNAYNEQPSSYVYVEETHAQNTSPRREPLGNSDWPNRQPSYSRAVDDKTRSKSTSSTALADRYRNPYYSGAYLNPEKQSRLQKFSTEKTQVNIPSQIGNPPEVKERKSAAQQAPVDIDFSAYDEPSMSLQQGSRAKIDETEYVKVVERVETQTVEVIDLDFDKYEPNYPTEPQLTSVDPSSSSEDENDFFQDRKLIENLRRKFLASHKPVALEAIPTKPKDDHLYVQPVIRKPPSKYLSRSDEDLRALKDRSEVKIRVIARHPARRSSESLAGMGLKPRLTRSFERINIEEKSGDEDSSAFMDYGEVVSVTGIGSNPMRREEIEREKRRLQEEFFKRIAGMERTPASRPVGSKLDDLIEAKIRREYAKAVKRINKRKWRVPEILIRLPQVKGKERKKLEDELTLLMRKAKIDNELVKKFGPLYAVDSSINDPKNKRKNLNSSLDGELETDEFETSSVNSFQRPPAGPAAGKYVKNPASKIEGNKYKKPSASQTNITNKTFESGYSSLDEYVSGGDLKSVGKKEPSRSSSQDLVALVDRVEKRRVRPAIESVNDKISEVAVEAPRVEAFQEIQVGVGADVGLDDEENNRPPRVPRRRRPQNNYAPPPTFQPRQIPINNPRYENLSDFSAGSYSRTTQGGQSGGQSGGSSNNSSYRNTTAPNSASQGNSGIYVNIDQSGGIVGDDSTSSNQRVPSRSSSTSPSSGRRRNDSSDSDRRRNIQGPLSPHSSTSSLEEINYVEEDELSALDPNQYDLIQNDETGESILVDLHVNDQFTVLPRNWRTAQDTYYIADEDVDFTVAQIYSDGRNRRRYVYDPRTTRRYFLVPMRCVKKLSQPGFRPVLTEDAPNVVQAAHKPDPKDQEIEVHYVEESELDGLDLTSFSVYRDEENDEVLLVDSGFPNRFWIVLRDDWRTAQDLPYLAEEDLSTVEMDVYTDSNTKRKFVIDDKTGERYFIVPKFRENIRNYVTASNVPIKAGKKVGFEDQKRAQSHDDLIVKKLGTEEIRHLTEEPSTFRLRKIAANTPERFKNRTLVPASSDSNKIVIKQPGKPGHVIKRPENTSSANQATGGAKRPITNQASSTKSASPAARKPGGDPKKPAGKSNADPAFVKARQEAARRAYFAQKLPYVGELWLHQQLIDETNNKKKLDNLKEAYLAQQSLNYEDDPDRYLDENGNVRSYRDLTDLNDPTLNDDKNGLDPNRLIDVQMNGYEKYNKNRRKIFGEKEENYGRRDNTTKMPNNKSFGGFENNYPFVRGILTEDFVEDREYAPVQLNSQYRALFPFTKLNLRQQFLLTPGYLRHTWDDIVHKPGEGLVPRIIIIDDDERIITKNRDCNVYVQYYYEHDGVLGADQAYQLMLPDRGPTKPTRPFKISPAKLSKKMEMLNAAAGVKKPQMALREAPVFVYHPKGGAYFQNLAQYLANKHPQLSPATVRKMLQFSDLNEFEDYLSAKCTREMARKIADESGELLINIDAIKGDLVKALSGDATYLDVGGCEYDPLRPYGKDESMSEDTQEFEVNGKIIKSTFIGIGNDGKVKRVKSNELPKNITNIVKDAIQAESSRNSATAAN